MLVSQPLAPATIDPRSSLNRARIAVGALGPMVEQATLHSLWHGGGGSRLECRGVAGGNGWQRAAKSRVVKIFGIVLRFRCLFRTNATIRTLAATPINGRRRSNTSSARSKSKEKGGSKQNNNSPGLAAQQTSLPNVGDRSGRAPLRHQSPSWTSPGPPRYRLRGEQRTEHGTTRRAPTAGSSRTGWTGTQPWCCA